MSIERTGAVSGYKSHKEINFESKQTLSALLADFRLYEIEPRMKTAYLLVNKLRNIFKKRQTRDEARMELHSWYKEVGKSLIRELIAVRDTIKLKEEYVLNYFINRSTNASAESINSKMKGFRSELRGVADIPFFMFRLSRIFG